MRLGRVASSPTLDRKSRLAISLITEAERATRPFKHRGYWHLVRYFCRHLRGEAVLNLAPGTLQVALADPYWMRLVGEGFHYEIEVQRWLSNLPTNSWDFVDVGANIGFWPVWYGNRNPESRIVVVEPNPEMHRLIRKNLEQLTNDVTVLRAAVAPPSVGPMTEFRVDPTPGYHANASLMRLSRETLGESAFNVPVLSLDSILRARHKVDRRVVVKLDIEGLETSVLKSMHDPDDESVALLYEDHGKDRSSEATAWLLEHTERKIYLLRSDSDPVPIRSARELLQWKASTKVGYNLIALPKNGPGV